MGRQVVWGAADPLPTQPFPAVIDAGTVQLTPIHTPGHSQDHTVFLAETARRRFAASTSATGSFCFVEKPI